MSTCEVKTLQNEKAHHDMARRKIMPSATDESAAFRLL